MGWTEHRPPGAYVAVVFPNFVAVPNENVRIHHWPSDRSNPALEIDLPAGVNEEPAKFEFIGRHWRPPFWANDDLRARFRQLRTVSTLREFWASYEDLWTEYETENRRLMEEGSIVRRTRGVGTPTEYPKEGRPNEKDCICCLWAYRSKVVSAVPNEVISEDELKLHIKHFVLKDEQMLARITRHVTAFDNLDRAASSERERIPEAVRLFVWQRDGGKCAQCGSKERLEFDHIIPVIEGGANTERNIQLLCEACNRAKGRRISSL